MERKMWRNGSWNKKTAELMVHSESGWSPSSRRKKRKKREERRRSGSEREGGRMMGAGWEGVSEPKERRSRQRSRLLWVCLCAGEVKTHRERSREWELYTVFMWKRERRVDGNNKSSFNHHPVRSSLPCLNHSMLLLPGQVTSLSQGWPLA